MKTIKEIIEQIFSKNNKTKTTIFKSVLRKDQYIVTFKMLDRFDHFMDLCIIKLKND